jgi:hypothetical protein
MAASAYGDRETQHFNRNILWAQLHLVEVVLLFGDAFFLSCKLDLYVLNGTLTVQNYGDQILRPLTMPHLDDHPLACQPILMNDNG